MAIEGEEKKAYQRELMRKRRAEARAKREAAGVALGATHRREFKEDGVYEDVPLAADGTVEGRLPWPLNKEKAPRWGEGVKEYVPPTEEEKEALKGMKAPMGGRPVEATDEEWDEALERAGRARGHFKKFPGKVKPSEMIYQDPCWQWEHRKKG